jgi:hypothetical protein
LRSQSANFSDYSVFRIFATFSQNFRSDRNVDDSALLSNATTEEQHMKRLPIVILATALLSVGAFAQTPAAKDGPGNNAVNSPNEKNSNAPVAGANSFTEGQAKSRIEAAGYTGVTDLKKDDNGVWRGKAAKGGSTSNVSIDFQGNVNAAR